MFLHSADLTELTIGNSLFVIMGSTNFSLELLNQVHLRPLPPSHGKRWTRRQDLVRRRLMAERWR